MTLENKGYIEIKITGKKGLLDISPETYDISELRKLLDTFEDLLFPENQKTRPLVSYEVKDGSVRHLFKTSVMLT
ncbi:MAG: hypothetical protein WC703_04855 [Candidatus Neomarinimicrobiota bacterium]